jgi:hypothetical protein
MMKETLIKLHNRLVKAKSRYIILLLLVVAVLVILSAVFVLPRNPKVSNNENPYDGIKITNFTLSGWGNPAGMAYDRWFNVSVTNDGKQNVTGLVLGIKVFINQTEFTRYSLAVYEYSPDFNFSINKAENKIFQGAVIATFESPIVFGRQPSDEISIQASISKDTVVIDEMTIPF